MKTIASMAILLSFAGTALAQESVSADRLGSWAPRDTNSCDTIYGDARQLCLADRYHIQQDAKAREQQGSLQRALCRPAACDSGRRDIADDRRRRLYRSCWYREVPTSRGDTRSHSPAREQCQQN